MKPDKPSPDFPLFAHASGKWAKKINGKLKYFGRWDDPATALAAYEALHRKPTAVPHVLTLKHASNLFLTAKKQKVTSGELAQRSWSEYHRTCQKLCKFLGLDRAVDSLKVADFDRFATMLASTVNLIGVGNEVTRVRTLFKWLKGAELIKEPIRFSPDFRKPSAKNIRRHRRNSGKKLFGAEQIQLMLDETGVHMRAMVLLGINCGFGNADCATMPISAVNLETGWIDYPRPKTEADRCCPLWPETIEALRVSLTRRYKPKPESEERFFVRIDGGIWDTSSNHVSKQFRQVLERCGIARGGFYWLRHTFETIAGGCKDQVAVNLIMGHVDPSISAVYREDVDRQRLTTAVMFARDWLFGSDP